MVNKEKRFQLIRAVGKTAREAGQSGSVAGASQLPGFRAGPLLSRQHQGCSLNDERKLTRALLEKMRHSGQRNARVQRPRRDWCRGGEKAGVPGPLSKVEREEAGGEGRALLATVMECGSHPEGNKNLLNS